MARLMDPRDASRSGWFPERQTVCQPGDTSRAGRGRGGRARAESAERPRRDPIVSRRPARVCEEAFRGMLTLRPAQALLYCELGRDDEAREAFESLATSGFDLPLDLGFVNVGLKH